MTECKSSVALIGLPGSGKSTTGVLLAKRLSQQFVDTDLLIQVREARALQQILDVDGVAALRRIEAEVISQLDVQRTLVATGGSAVYGGAAMQALKAQCVVCYLEVTEAIMLQRLGDFSQRGIAMPPGFTLPDMYRERVPLYERYADFAVDATQPTEEVVSAIAELLAKRHDFSF